MKKSIIFSSTIDPQETAELLKTGGEGLKRAYNVSVVIVAAWRKEIALLDHTDDKGNLDGTAWSKALWSRLPSHMIETNEDGEIIAFSTLKDKKNENRKGHAMALQMHNISRWIRSNQSNLEPEHFAALKAETPEQYSDNGEGSEGPENSDNSDSKPVITEGPENSKAAEETAADLLKKLRDMVPAEKQEKRCFSELESLLKAENLI